MDQQSPALAQLSDRALKKLAIALAIYLTSLFAANTLGLKLMPFFWSHISVGIFPFAVVFVMTDIVGEVYGKRIAKMFVLAGAISTILFIAYSLISIVMPWSADGLWAKDAYNTIFGISTRISIASVVAFVVGEYQDVIAFFFFRAKLGDKHFWIRSNLSNIWSQLLDTVIFMMIAFAGIYSWPVLGSLIISWWLFKVAMGFAYTPFSYIGIYLLRDNQGNQN